MQERHRRPRRGLYGRTHQCQRDNRDIEQRQQHNQRDGIDRIGVDRLKLVSSSGLGVTVIRDKKRRGRRVGAFGCIGDGRLGDAVKKWHIYRDQ